MDEDFEILYDDDVIDFPDDLPQIEEIHQEENGQTTPTMKSVISRMENHSEDIRLSTLQKVAAVFGKQLRVAMCL